ncbi:RDD family protein [Demequina aurantiaca]|uniref:RDD family protein n=1 Tax=Demequina aurantiaca TaxID=676200 RepID=UPI003D3442D8
MSTSELPIPDAPARPAVGRRLLGLGIDWTLSLVISSAFFANAAAVATAGPVESVFLVGNSFATLGVWAAQHFLLVATLGTTIGHRVVGVKVVREDGSSPVGLVSGLTRTLLLVVVVPALFTDPEGRGYHDRTARTRLVRTR